MYAPKEAIMLMRTNYETLSKAYSTDRNYFDIKPGKWEREYWESYSYRCPTPDCDTKRTGPCKAQADSKK